MRAYSGSSEQSELLLSVHSVEAAKQRQSIVLDQMVKYGYITESEAAAAKEADIILARPQEQRGTDSVASYFCKLCHSLDQRKV